MDLKCKFGFIFHVVAEEKVYSCDVESKAVSGVSREVKSFEGRHVVGNCNQNVDVAYFPEGSSVGFPLNLPAFFPKLISLSISNCSITELSRQDLVGLEQLQNLGVYNNPITTLPNDLFANTPNLRIINFHRNEIEKLSSRLLDYLNWNILERVSFGNNSKIDEIFERGQNFISTTNAAQNYKRKCHSTLSTFRSAIDECCSQVDESENNTSELGISGAASDFLIKVNGVEVRVHKDILTQHSSVFSAMFNHDMEENRTNEMTINEYSAEVVQDMVRYIYTGKIRNVDNIVDLYAISSQYWITGLQQLCQEIIIENIDESNMIEVLKIGHMYSSQRMKQAAFKKFSENFSLKPLDEKLIDRPDKLEKLIQLKRQFDAECNQISKE